MLVSICRQLDGMPLAIELAAARLRSLSLSDLHDRLDQRFRLLTGGSRTALARQQTLRATVDWSYSLLTGAEQLLLRRLSVFAEGFDLDAAEAVCGFGDIEAFDVTDLLGSLVDKSLVVAEPTGETLRYRMLETIRQFAAERLAETGPGEAAAVAAAHRAHFLSVAEAAAPHLTGPDQGRWLARLDADQANLQRATGARGRRPGRDHAGPALRRRAEALLDGALAARGGHPAARAGAGPARGPGGPPAVHRSAGRRRLRPRPRHDGSACNRESRPWPPPAGSATSGCSSTPSRSLCGNYYFAGAAGARDFPSARSRSSVPGGSAMTSCWARACWCFLLSADLIGPARAEQLFAEAIACTERSGDQLIAYLLRNNAGVHALRAGDLPAARAHLEQAARAARAIGQESSAVSVNLGWVLRQDGDPDGARPMFEAGLRIGRRNGDRPDMAYACLGLACLAADRGDWYRAGTAARCRAGPSRPDRRSMARPRSALPPGKPQPAARPPWAMSSADRAYAEGMALSLDQALDLASEQPAQREPSCQHAGFVRAI